MRAQDPEKRPICGVAGDSEAVLVTLHCDSDKAYIAAVHAMMEMLLLRR